MRRNRLRWMLPMLGGASASSLLTGLVAYWKLDESSDGSGAVTRADSVGSNDLTDFNTTASAVGIVVNGANFELDNKEYLYVASNTALQTGDIDFTVDLWVKLETKDTTQWFVCKWGDSSANREWLVRYLQPEDRFQFMWYINASGTVKTAVANQLGSPAVNTWYHIVAIRNKTAQTISIIVNAGTADTATYATSGNAGAGPVRIGADGQITPAFHVDGIVDEVGMWKKVLSAEEITTRYNGGSGNTYPFDGAAITSGIVIYDGNSMTDGSLSIYPQTATNLLTGSWFHYNFGVSGQTTIEMIEDGVAQIDSIYDATASANVVVFWEVTNDLKLGATREDAQARMVTYCQARQLAGFKVVVGTILPRTQVGLPETFEADRIAINAYIRESYATFADAVADVAGDSRIGDAGDSNDTTYYTDGVHMTTAGYNIVAGIVAAAIESL